MSADAAEAAIDKLILLYGEPKTKNVSAWISEYRLALCGFHDEAIRAGIDELLRTRLMRGWPMIGECVKACRDVAPKVVAKSSVPTRMPWEPKEAPRWVASDECRARVSALVAEFKRNMAASGIAHEPRDDCGEDYAEPHELASDFQCRMARKHGSYSAFLERFQRRQMGGGAGRSYMKPLGNFVGKIVADRTVFDERAAKRQQAFDAQRWDDSERGEIEP